MHSYSITIIIFLLYYLLLHTQDVDPLPFYVCKEWDRAVRLTFLTVLKE